MPRKCPPLPKLDNIGSLITFEDGDRTCCLGYLMHFEGRGVYDPTYGRVEVSPEDADEHNRLLDKGMVEGLDNQCEVGQGNCFYVSFADGRWMVRTFTGTLISNRVRVVMKPRGMYFIFARDGRKFRGRKRPGYAGEDVFFKRIK